ncbi:peptide chain release factor N(5)-glutamine methyltransferase [Enterococcus thailandicus]|uniref:peptide chain release factor N(5)-glutamine methyltransferase n=1 Tax=Enterococcus thailandicus TaxID=417368 RepID=UPI0022EBA801|nr:peptide chain release factor N(5)-glutamine methyltransferase [Enterococcus thailandicus]MDA3973827.1 peptide chain release factor N(5)-glutamine methyltransferase [Enterococcus thailandicus]MDA3976360.1 peptide chain release factor N(5)-glutamine methyltransferase [Enterococcus thailandicus]MDA3981325.1 peptide chain release factor N(5)-glutamine methyltransferase [Enterococcus thailandicus]
MDKKTYREALLGASSFLEAQGKEGYSIQFLFLERKQWQKLDWLLHMNEVISEADQLLIQTDMKLLLENHPPQYLLGYADFYGHRLKVTEATLIPRPETEELVDWCLAEVAGSEQTIIDIGTGTGAIAISLKAERPEWQVSAVDLSASALDVAKENAEKEQAEIDFYLGDTLEPVLDQRFDIIISNPPYISHKEWDLMDESVRTFEPKMALFAEDDGLAIYRKIAKEAPDVLTEEGKIFLEIGFRQGEAVQKIFQQAFPQKTVIVKKDLSGNERMIQVY